MFTLGIALIAIGCALNIYIKISSIKYERELAPQNIILHNSQIEDLKILTRRRSIDANILLLIGIVLVLITGVFN